MTPPYTDDPVLVERVARALYEIFSDRDGEMAGEPVWKPWNETSEVTQAGWRCEARAALDQEEEQVEHPGWLHLPALIADRLGVSRSTARRDIAQGGVRIDGQVVTDCDYIARGGEKLEYGKRRSFLLPAPPDPESAESSEPCPATGGQHVLARDGSYCLECGAIRPTPLSESGEA